MDFFVSVEWLGLSTEKNYQQNGQILRCLIRELFKPKFTVFILVICSLLITYYQFKGPISCKYTNNYPFMISSVRFKIESLLF